MPKTYSPSRSSRLIEDLEIRRMFAISLSGATNLSTLQGQRAFTDSVSSANLYDIRKFGVSQAAPVWGKTSGLSANCDLSVVKDTNANGVVDAGETIASSALTGTSSDSFSFSSLAAGTYYVIVSAVNNATANYTLTLNSDYAGATLGASRSLGAVGATRSTYYDWVGSSDTDDFYRFTTAGTQWVKANLAGLGADANIQLIKDANANGAIDSGDVIASSSNTGTTADAITRQVSAGTYFLRVYRSTGDTNYSLTLSAPWLNIVFKYDFDANNFFNNNPTAKDRMEDAAAVHGVYLDQLSAITPGGTNSWSVIFSNPGSNGGANVTVSNLSIPSNTLYVYVGGRSDLGSLELGRGGPGGFSASGTTAFLNTVQARGQSGVLLSTPTDFATWGGGISFSTTANWNFSSSAPSSGQNDFLSVATHELAHILGIGTAKTWTNKVVNGKFTGTNATAAYGGTNPAASSGHWAEGVRSTVNGVSQEASMDPSLLVGTRKYFTKLDFAGLADVGWQLPSTPTNTGTASVAGTVFSDADGNGSKGASEVGLSGWTVFYDANKNNVLDAGEISTTTNSSGAFTLSGLPAGTDRVYLKLNSGYRYTNPWNGLADVTLTSGQAVTGKLFGVTSNALISGNVYNDANGNAVKDSTETGLSAWTVFIDSNNNGVLDSGEKSQSTDSSGNFFFRDIAAGTYILRIVQKSTYKITTPLVGYYSVTVASGQTTTKTFGEKLI